MPAPDCVAGALAQAVDAARAHVGATAPNPPVGCVLLSRHGERLAVGAHERAGQPHAEVVALERCRAAGRLADAHTLVVTLEPCNRTGRTPPCTRAILASPVRAVWAGLLDPTLDPPSGGLAALRGGGLRAERVADSGPAAHAALAGCGELIRGFAHRHRTGRPWVVVKQALDPEGSMIPPPGRTTFTSDRSLRLAHELRRGADAILTGLGTVVADRPRFTVRHVPDHLRRPTRRLVLVGRPAGVPAAWAASVAAAGFNLHIVEDAAQALDLLGGLGALRVLVEAGPRLTATLLERDLWDEWVLIRKRAWDDGEDEVTVRLRR